MAVQRTLVVPAAPGAPAPPVDPLTPAPPGSVVLITDHPWPDVDIESAICEAAGYELVDGASRGESDDLLELGASAAGILTNWAPVTAELIANSPQLRVVGRLGVGVDNIDLAAAAARGVVVTRVPDYCVEEVSDHAVALVLAWARGIPFFDRAVRAGRFEPGALALRRVRDLEVGIWGTGRNGMATARKLAALGCTVRTDDRNPARSAPFPALPVAALVESADVLSVHLPLTEETRGILDARLLSHMRPGSLLVNTGRGHLVDVDALVAALDAGRPGAAALDVVPGEPEVPAVLLGRDDVCLTPHVAFSSVASIAEVRRRATEDVVRVLRGERPLDPYLADPYLADG